MTLARFPFVVCLAGLLISLMILIVLFTVYFRGDTFFALIMIMGPLMKIGAILLVLIAAASLVVTAMHRLQKRKNDRLALALRIMAGASVAVGMLCALDGWSAIQNSLWQTNTVTFDMEAPFWAHIALLLTLGFLPAVIALLGAAPVRVERRGL